MPKICIYINNAVILKNVLIQFMVILYIIFYKFAHRTSAVYTRMINDQLR